MMTSLSAISVWADPDLPVIPDWPSAPSAGLNLPMQRVEAGEFSV